MLGEVLTKSELTFLVTLRLLNNKEQDESLESILQELYSNRSELQTTLANILEKDGEGVCFILDGLDEYNFDNKEKSVIILQLLDRKLLPKSMIITFSRPSATRIVKMNGINKRIEVFGFSKEQISHYIDNFPFEREDGSFDNSVNTTTELKEYLHYHPSIHDMCYLPIHVAMICFLFQLSKILSPTQTRVYEEFTLSIIYRLLVSQESCLALNSLKDLKGAHAKYFKDLCHLAYEMTIKSKQVVSSQELKDWLGGRGSLSEEAGLGLLTICPTLQKTGIYQNYAFLHLTFQEFLAAYYIANYLDESQQMELLEEYSPHMRTVWLFYSGLICFEDSKKLLDVLLKNQKEYDIFRCALESQQKCVCTEIIRIESQNLQFRHTGLAPIDLLAIEYIVTTSSLPITKLEIYGMNIDDITSLLNKLIKADLQYMKSIGITIANYHHTVTGCQQNILADCFCELLKKSINLETLYLSISEHKSTSSALKLANQINKCVNLLDLTIKYSGTPECIQTFFSSLCIHIPKFNLFFKNLCIQCFRALCVGLQNLHSSHLSLNICDTTICSDNMTVLLDSLQNFKSLQLAFSKSYLDHNGLVCLSRKLKDIKLQGLDLSQTYIGPCGVTILTGRKYLTTLQNLDLARNDIGSGGAIALAGVFKHLTALKTLNLSNNGIGSDGVIALASEFRFLTELMTLNLSYNDISYDCTIALVNEFKFLTKLKTLNLSHNDIGSDDTIALASEFKFLTALRELDLSFNNIGSDAAFALACGVRCLTNLRYLSMQQSYVDYETEKSVIAIWQESKNLEEIHFSNTIDERCTVM